MACVAVLSSCSTAGKLSVSSVSYQSLRTDFAQPKEIAPEAKIAVEYFFNSDGEMQPVIYNLTPDILIVDQTKSFVIMPGGTSVSYYDPAVRTTTTGSYTSATSGSSFNLGGVAAALGIGGPLGALASATSVNSSHTDGISRQNTVIITDQPQVSIGPKGSMAMSKAFPIDGIGSAARTNDNIIDIPQKNAGVKFSVCISYSTDDGATFDKLVTNFYVNSLITVPVYDKKVSKAFYTIYELKPDALAENMFLFSISDNIRTKPSQQTDDFLIHTNVYDTYIQGSLIDFQ